MFTEAIEWFVHCGGFFANNIAGIMTNTQKGPTIIVVQWCKIKDFSGMHSLYMSFDLWVISLVYDFMYI